MIFPWINCLHSFHFPLTCILSVSFSFTYWDLAKSYYGSLTIDPVLKTIDFDAEEEFDNGYEYGDLAQLKDRGLKFFPIC